MKNSEKFAFIDIGCLNTSAEVYYSCSFKNCDFSDAVFSNCSFESCNFESCNLSNMRLKKTKFIDTSFRECKLTGVTWPQEKIPSSCSFYKCILSYNIFSDCILGYFKFKGCSFKGSFFQDCNAPKCDFSGCDFSDVRFENCNLSKSVFCNVSNLFLDPDFNNVTGAKVPVETAIAMLKKYQLEIVD